MTKASILTPVMRIRIDTITAFEGSISMRPNEAPLGDDTRGQGDVSSRYSRPRISITHQRVGAGRLDDSVR